jgi:hypothetical protein
MPDVGVAPALYEARPRFTVDGRDQPALGDQLIEMAVEDTVAGLSHCEATFANWGPVGGAVGFLYFGRDVLEFGKAFNIAAGGGAAAGQIFDGRIMGLEGRFHNERPPEILVLAEDRLQDLRKTRRTQAFEQIRDADLFQQVASRHSLRATVDIDGPTHRVLTQVNQTDLAFLRERARALDAELWIEGNTLHAVARGRRSAGTVTLTFGQGLHECSVLADLAEQVSGFTVSGWDVAGKRAISFRATDMALAGELNGDQGGSRVLAQAIGDRDQQVVHDLPFTSQEGQALAESRYRQTARRFVVGTGTAEGDARLRVGTKLELRGVGSLFDGKYYVTRVRHLFDTLRGYRTHFTVERPGIGR